MSRETLRDWQSGEDRLMSEEQGTIIYHRRGPSDAEQLVTEWVREQTAALLQPLSIADAKQFIEKNAPSLLQGKSYTAQRSFTHRLLDRGHTKNECFALINWNSYGKELVVNFPINIADYNVGKIRYMGVGVKEEATIEARIPIEAETAATAPKKAGK